MTFVTDSLANPGTAPVNQIALSITGDYVATKLAPEPRSPPEQAAPSLGPLHPRPPAPVVKNADPSLRYTPPEIYQYQVTASSTSGVQLSQIVTLNLTVTARQ